MHPSMVSIMRAFDNSHLDAAPEDVQKTFDMCAGLAEWMVTNLSSSSEVVAGLRHLVEAKDCFVRQAAWTVAEGSSEA